jgi:ketosteroid isomerase-like protein
MKNLLIPFLLFLSLYSCTTQNKKDMTADNEKLIKQYFDHFNNHDWVKMASLYADPADFRDPSLGQEIVKQTRAQTVKKYEELSAAFKDIRDSITAIYPSGEKHIIVEFVSSGTAPDGSKFTLPICTIFTIENGLITKDYTYYDNFEE